MAPIPNTDRRPDITQSSIKEWRDGQLVGVGNYSNLAIRPWAEVRAIEIFPGSRLDAPVLEVPAAWMPAGTLRRPGARIINPARAGVPDDPVIAAKRDEAIRRALHALWLPRAIANRIRESKPATWKAHAQSLLRLALWQFENLPSSDGSVFTNLTSSEVMTCFYPAVKATHNMQVGYEVVLASLIDAGERGVISDWPKNFTQQKNLVKSERTRKISAVRARVSSSKSYEAFSDEFVTEFARRAMWLQANIADQCIDFWKEHILPNSNQMNEGLRPSASAIMERLRAFPWRDATGVPLENLPFQLKQYDGSADGSTAYWPPKTLVSFKRIINTIQGCNCGIINLCTGARSSEILAADDTPLGHAEGRYKSVTFKLIDDISGRPRDWPLHPIAVRALEIQHRLASAVRPQGEQQLWVALHRADAGARLTSASTTFGRTIEHLGLEHLIGSSNAHMHRWRHTVARLVALAVVGAPQVLLDLFGHRDLDMALRYILSTPGIVEEAMQVAKESTFALAKGAILETVSGRTSGPAAASLRRGLSIAMRRGEDIYDAGNLNEVAEILTFSGRSWSIVRPGVICTRGLDQGGACTTGRGDPDRASCRASCEHRLETAAAKQQCEDTLAALIETRQSALNSREEMVVAHLNGQIVAELKRWPDVRMQVLATHPELGFL